MLRASQEGQGSVGDPLAGHQPDKSGFFSPQEPGKGHRDSRGSATAGEIPSVQGGAGGTSWQTGSWERNKLRCPGMDQTQVKQMDSGSFVGFLNENKIHFRSDLSNQSVLLC